MTRFPVEPAAQLSPAEKLKLSLQMFDYGCQLMRENLRRKFPGLDDLAIEAKLHEWLRHRPDDEFVYPLRQGSWPRVKHGE